MGEVVGEAVPVGAEGDAGGAGSGLDRGERPDGQARPVAGRAEAGASSAARRAGGEGGEPAPRGDDASGASSAAVPGLDRVAMGGVVEEAVPVGADGDAGGAGSAPGRAEVAAGGGSGARGEPGAPGGRGEGQVGPPVGAVRAAEGGAARVRVGAPEPARWFFGRQRELKALHGDIERAGLNTIAGRRAAHTRVLLIAGQSGSGRTALARELARQVGRRYPDGVLHIRLTEPGGEPVPVERTARDLLGGFGIDVPPGAADDEMSEMVREALAVRRVLLLLDDAHDAEQVDLLLPENPDCLVVAVARGPLTGIPDIRPCTIGGLDAKAAMELLGTFTGSVRITVDPQAAESLAEECGGQPAAIALVGGWLATHPRVSVADVAKRLRAVPEDLGQPQGSRLLARAFRFVYEDLPPSTAGMLRLLSLAPAGLADAHTASALAGCSVSAAGAALDDLAALNLLRPVGDQFEIVGALAPMTRALMAVKDRPAEVQLARARMLERTVRLLQSCRAVTEPDGSPARKKLAALPRAVRFPTTRAAADWLTSRRPALLASARLAVADGELDTLARRLVSALVRALAAHQGTDAAAPDLYGLHQLVLGVAERQGLHREEAAALLNIGDLDARSGRTRDALARYRSALDAGRAANDHYATGRAMESVGGAYQELQDWHRAADWYGRALAQRLSRGERADEARLYGRLGTVHTYAGRYGEALRHWRAAAAGFRRLQDLPGQARALSEAARVQEYAGRPEESLHTCQEAVEYARLAGDTRLQAALELRLADTLDRLGDPTAARLHRHASDRLLGTDSSTYEIRSTSAEG
ncbi:tetratricopeptide repeat protein [Streptomyces niveus]|uniref:tetratricopeptide repeat protein n=1 Tax=Streptomyces niveus TaxID=193462 RepID=UPI0036D8E030